MSADVVRLPGGRVMTRTRAQALGLIDATGAVTADAPADSQAAKALERDARAAAWRERQGLDAGAGLTRGQKAAATRAANRIAAASAPVTGVTGEPQVDEEGRPVKRQEPQPLQPKNVDHDGQPIEDPEALAKIAAETAEIEARKAAERDEG